jgi:hypothetical protein
VEDHSAPILEERTSKLGRTIVVRSLRPCLRNGASRGKESVLADSGRVGEISAGAGRIRTAAFLSSLRGTLPSLEGRSSEKGAT